jgi:hypothetical protein
VNRWINFSPQIHRNFSGKKTDLQHVRMMSSYGMRRNDSIEIALEVKPLQNACSRINSRLLSSLWYSFVIFDYARLSRRVRLQRRSSAADSMAARSAVG